MLSRLTRNKSEAQQVGKPLRGMPALKQMRSSQRQEALLPKLSSPVNQPQPNTTDNTTRAQHNGKANNKITKNGHGQQHSAFRPHVKSEVERRPNKPASNRLSYQEPPANNGMSLVADKPKQREGSAKDKKPKPIQSTGTKSPTSTKAASSPTKKSDNKGRHLHSLKKARKESRENSVSTSMRALTPRERESILFLEEIIQQHDEWSLDACEEENVFDDSLPNVAAENGHDTTDSDTTSLESFIDLVENPSSYSSPQLSDDRMSVNKNNSNNATEFVDLPDDKIPREDIYAEVDRRAVEKKRANKIAKKHLEKQPEPEPVYAAVKKSKKKSKSKAQKKDGDLKSGQPAEGNGDKLTPYQDEPTAKSSRIFWEKMNTKRSPVEEPSVEKLLSAKLRLTPTSSINEPNPWKRSDSIEKVPGASKNNFIVRPSKTRGSASSRSSQGSYQSDHSGRHSSHSDRSPMYLDVGPIAPSRKSDVKRTPDTDSDADSGCQADPCMVAIPRQTVLSTSPANSNKPFVIMTAKNSVISFS